MTQTLQREAPRVAVVAADVVEAISDVVRRRDVTLDELRAAVEFLTETVQAGELPLMAEVLFAAVVDDARAHGEGTRSNVEGPFYVEGAPLLDAPFELPGASTLPGEPLVLSGTVRTVDGRPLARAALDVWHADGEGRYSQVHPDLQDMQLRGRVLTDANGRYELRTVVPSPYAILSEGPTARLLAALGRRNVRPAHVHVKLSHPDADTLTTQLYFADDPWLRSDPVGAVKDELIVSLRAAPHGHAAAFDFALRPAGKVYAPPETSSSAPVV